ncbi:MAG: hypothetical protein HDS54_06540 [Barnesiella sp.]|nr:hypothetical protein [Barnesiella sp.]MBD5257348.1 hypothetical protein [Barnesiella sp.]
MKKFFILFFILFFSLTAFTQKDVTKFLGIPVDGTKSEMIEKLKAKGFKPTLSNKDVLKGEFNGYDVYVEPVTNGNKVYRIFVEDANPVSESDIKIRFNKLCRQFEKNDKYTSFGDYIIPEDEDISTQMDIYKKRFQASFYQKPEMIDTVLIYNLMDEKMGNLYTPEQLENPTEEVKQKINEVAEQIVFDIMRVKTVWFMISKEGYNKYSIVMFYDNEYNHADGEDL